MTDSTAKTATDYRDTVFLPTTDFPMKAGLPQKEPAILAKWQADDLYTQLRAARAGRDQFILHDGPPYANGDMHIGHAMQRILKDMVVRTQSLKGKDAPFVPGWDCHGLPIEWKVEEQYRKAKKNKDEVPVEEFRAECRAYAQHWVNVQREQIQRLGVLGNWADPYLTMDFQAEAVIVEELLKFATSGQLYRGAKPVMWSPVEKTALAEAEVEYEDITSTQIDVRGRKLGFPTANIDMGSYLRPRYGIYAVTGTLPDGRVLKGAANLGIRPSFDPPKELLEPHFFDFAGDLYGQEIDVAFHAFIRPEAKFDSLDALMAQMALDCDAARAVLP